MTTNVRSVVLLWRKATICREIEKELKEQMEFEAVYFKKQQTINALRSKIADKVERVKRLKQRIANVSLNANKSKKNVALLEKKMNTHSERISRMSLENATLRNLLVKAQENLNRHVFHTTLFLSEIFPIHKFEKRPGNNADAWSGQQQKKFFYSIRDASVTDEGAYLRLGEELCSSVSSLSLESRQTMSALTYCCQLVDAFSSVLHCILPYRNLAQDLALSVRWSEDLFSTTLFKIQYSIIRLCLEQGVSSETLLFHCPLNNLFQLITVLRAQKRNSVNTAAFDSKLRVQIVDEFHKIKWEERKHDFTLDNVEEDWVNVDFASSKSPIV